MAEPALKSFTLIHPDTGQTLVVEGARQPTQEEAEQLFLENPPPQESLPEGDAIDAVMEPVQAMASGVAGSVASGLAGTAQALNPFADEGAGAETVEAVQSEFAEMGAPETQAGQKSMETLQDLVDMGVNLARIPVSAINGLATLISTRDPEQAKQTIADVNEFGVGATLGKASFDATGDPLIATLAEMLPNFAETAMGLGAMRGVNAIDDAVSTPRLMNPDVNPVADARTAKGLEFKQKIADDIRSGSTDVSVAKYIVDGAGKVQGDDIAKEAIKQGFDPAVVSAVKGAPPADRAKMLQMLETMKTGKQNARFAMDNRPSDVAGESLMQRVRHLRDINKTSGKALDGVAKSLKGRTDADFTPAINNFLEELDSMGVDIDPRTFKANYDNSIVRKLPEPTKAIDNMLDFLKTARKTGQMPDSYNMHMLKKYIDENVTFGGKGGEGLKGKTENIMKKLRRDIDGALDEAYPEYNRVNTEYADTRGAIDALQDTAGRKIDLEGVNADKATGTLLRRLMSNYSNRVNLYDALHQIDVIGRKYGGDFADDLKTQILFANALDDQFGAVAKTSLAGETEKAVRRNLREMSLMEIPVEGIARGAEKLRNINDDQAFKSMEELLRREIKNPPQN